MSACTRGQPSEVPSGMGRIMISATTIVIRSLHDDVHPTTGMTGVAAPEARPPISAAKYRHDVHSNTDTAFQQLHTLDETRTNVRSIVLHDDLPCT